MSTEPKADRLPEDVRDIVLKAMAKQPDDRIQSMDQLADLLVGKTGAIQKKPTDTKKQKKWWPF